MVRLVPEPFRPDFAKAGGLITAVTVDAENGEVLMVAHMNTDAFERTVATGQVHYWSRSRGALWKKGETSGNVQRLVELRVDCDADAVLLRVHQDGPACHEGFRSCFYRSLTPEGALRVDAARLRAPEEMYGPRP
jgi:phosphoribosyl-AMP cyclohydrolase